MASRPAFPLPPIPKPDPAEVVPPRYAWAKFDSPELTSRVRCSAVDIERAKKFAAGRALLTGLAGKGKTSLACAMLNNLMRNGALFVGAYWLAKARHEHRIGGGEAPLVERALDASILVLDDVGIEKALNTAVEEVIYERHANDMITIVTTGFSGAEMSKKYGDGIARRLYEGATVIKCG